MPKKITIVYIITGLGTGGAEIMLCNLLSATDKKKITPVVISLSDEGSIGARLRAQGIAVYSMHMRQGKIPSLGLIAKIVKLVGRIKPDLIQGWMYHGNLAAQLVRFFLFRKIPVVWTIHHTIEHLADEKAMTRKIIRIGAWLSGLPSKIIYVSAVSRAQHAAAGYYDKKSGVINNGVDINLFIPSADHRKRVREECKLPADCLLIGVLARYHPVKGHAVFLEAASLLQQRFPAVHFLLAGRDIDWHNTTLKEMISRFNINNIRLLGERKDIPALAASLDILTLSSHAEAFPLIIAEAMSCEIPCVSTSVGDTAMLIADTGLFVPPANPAALATAWEELVTFDPQTRKEMGKRARARIAADYSLPAVVEKYESLYYALQK